MSGTNMAWKVGVFAGLLGILNGCPGGTTTPPDAGPPPTDGGGGHVFPTLPRATNGTPAMPEASLANYDCVGTRTAPTPGANVSYTFELRGFGSGDAVANARVFFFPDNVPQTVDCTSASPTCTGSCITFTTDSSGNGSVMGPASAWYAYSICPRPGATMASTYVDSLQINESAPAAGGTAVEGNAVSVSTLNLIPAAFGFTRVPDSAIVAGEISDCDGDQVRGGYVRLFDASGAELLSVPDVNDAPHIQYFDGNENPDGSTTFSQVDGLYAAANIPAPASGFAAVRAEAYAVIEDGGAPVLVSCESVGVYADGVSIVNLGPLRSDYPAGHPCEGVAP